MIIDVNNVIVENWTLSTLTKTDPLIVPANELDLGPMEGSIRDIGAGSPAMHWVVVCTEAPTHGGGRFSLITDSAATMASAVECMTSPEIADSSYGAGDIIIRETVSPADFERYVTMQWKPAVTTAESAGKLTSFLTPVPPNWRAYAAKGQTSF